ncbi:hypothetical protein L0F63_000370 [Massospora cicadina]|nr:hypothetical protein L0F63_000370 [Massospora cicadina]
MLILGWLDEGSPKDINNLNKYVPVVKDQKDLSEVEAKVRTAELEIQSGNRTSRVYLLAGVVAIIGSIYSQGEGDFPCKACQTGIAAAARISRLPMTQSMVLFALKKMCERISGGSDAICEGVAETTGAVLYQVLNEVDLDNPHVRQVTCFALVKTCPMPEIPARPQRFPPIRENRRLARASANKFKYILQLTDMHYDDNYATLLPKDSNNNAPNITHIKRPAGRWGEFRCDMNKEMLNSLLDAAMEVGRKFPYDMVLFTGDILAHDVWKYKRDHDKRSAAAAFNILDKVLGKAFRFYPAVGNHESVPVNLFPLNGKLGFDEFYLYHFLTEEWKKWLPPSALATVNKGGYYSVNHNQKLKVIALNSNLCYVYNFHLLLDPSNPDPNGILQWLTTQLQDAEDNSMRVFILGHVPPGSKDCYQHWSDRYYKIIQRYYAIISAQFFGHEHSDQFQLFYSSERKLRSTAISHAFVAPSMTPFDGHNPGFRVYKVDAETYQPIDYTQYYADMSHPGAWNAKAVNWKILYTARTTYGPSILKNLYKPNILRPEFWHRVTEKLNATQPLFKTFYRLRTLNASLQSLCEDVECRTRYICSLRAGRSRDNCDVPIPFS